MFDPFFPILLVGGLVALVALLWIEARRTTTSLRPRFETVALALVATVGMSEWFNIFIVERYGVGMTAEQFNRVALLTLVAAGAIVVGCYLAVALIRKLRTSRSPR